MSIDIRETFKVAAPIDKVWEFLLSPDNIVACMPGASLTEVIDARRFAGAVKIKIGAVSAQYQGQLPIRHWTRMPTQCNCWPRAVSAAAAQSAAPSRRS
ncbi:MAG: hypothetical protein IPP88_10045 [Betaproteobacteria bacterium]|nr:hypothetical protein [Betaproteobacteria bacterium]